jgi:hypothetical protein
VVRDDGLDHSGNYNITLNKIPDIIHPGIYGPYPAAACDQPQNLTLNWEPVPNATSYDVYVGTGGLSPLSLVGGNIMDSSWSLTNLEKETVYYWQVIAQTPDGVVTGPVNWFITELMCDLNHDCSCNILDWPLFTEDWGSSNCNDSEMSCECDLNNDGSCNILDWPDFIKSWGVTSCQAQNQQPH